MSSIALSNAIGNLPGAQATTAIKPASAEAAAGGEIKANGNLKQDTIKLSVSAQIKSMHHQGQSPMQIAQLLGTSVASVDGYLGIKVAVPSTATSTAPQAPAESGSEPAKASAPASTTASPSPEPTASSTVPNVVAASEKG